MIKPTNGRVVLYTPGSHEPEIDYKGDPLTAHVVHVWNDRMVNLVVFDAHGAAHKRSSVPLLQEDDAAPDAGYFAMWMPYQKGQAAKAEAAEAKLAASVAE